MKQLSSSDRFSIVWVCALGALVPFLQGAPLHDFRCSDLPLAGCKPAYSCVTWTAYPCDLAGGNSASKRGSGIPYHVCVSDPSYDCDLVNVPCFKDIYYTQANCTGDLCSVYVYYTPGCEPGG